MVTLIAEKPSAGMELARITGCRTRRDGYMDGGRIDGGPLDGKPCRVTWAFGHLIEIGQDAATAALHWREENLPVIPDRFTLEPRKGRDGKADAGVLKQLATIRKLFADSEAIVNCGDAGREGELIQRYILRWCIGEDPSCDRPVWRMWTSSMTDEALRAGLRSLRPSREYDALYEAGRSRNEADWLVGVNATEALTLAVRRMVPGERRVLSLGRVQTPTLALVCSRWLENREFKAVPFWTVRVTSEKEGMRFTVTGEPRYDTSEAGEAARAACAASRLTVESAERKPRTVQPPLPHDVTSLQQEAAKRLGYDPDRSLAILQRLYEAKLVTYPRTGSRFIPEDVLHTVPGRLRAVAKATEGALSEEARRLAEGGEAGLNRRCVNDGKVTDHHALLVEATSPGDLSGDELRVYLLVAERMAEAFGTACECEVTTVRMACGGIPFTASTTKVLKPGWKAVRGTDAADDEGKEDAEDGKEREQRLPDLRAGDSLPVLEAESVEGKTKPKPVHTMNSLLEAMKTAGRESGDDEVKAAMKDTGIGTPATRAAILSTLMDARKFIAKEKGKVVPTETGLEVYRLVKDMAIADVELTGRWEVALGLVADGRMDPAKFDSMIRDFTRQITAQVRAVRPAADSKGLGAGARTDLARCPACGGTVRIWEDNARCTDRGCGLYMGRTVFGKRLTEAAVKRLLEEGSTGVLKGFTSKAGKTFDAALRLEIVERDGRKYANAAPVFEDRKPAGKAGPRGGSKAGGSKGTEKR